MLEEHWTDITSHESLLSGIPRRETKDPSDREWIAPIDVSKQISTTQLIAWFAESQSEHLILAISQNDGTQVYYRVNKDLEDLTK